MAEMWGSVVASLLFWGFANEVTTVDEAKKYCKFRQQHLYPKDILVGHDHPSRLWSADLLIFLAFVV